MAFYRLRRGREVEFSDSHGDEIIEIRSVVQNEASELLFLIYVVVWRSAGECRSKRLAKRGKPTAESEILANQRRYRHV